LQGIKEVYIGYYQGEQAVFKTMELEGEPSAEGESRKGRIGISGSHLY
jgi:hypothetical protein